MGKAKQYAKPQRRFRKPLLLPPERSAHGEHDYELVMEIAAELVPKSDGESNAVIRAFALLDKCQDVVKGRPYSVASVARVAAMLVEGHHVDESVLRALTIAESYAEVADQRHRLRVRRGIAASLRFLSKASKSTTNYVKIITQEERADRAYAKLKAFLLALARGDVPSEIQPDATWIVRPPSDPRSSAMDAFIERIKQGEIPRGYILHLQKMFKIYQEWTKRQKCAESGRLRHKNQT